MKSTRHLLRGNLLLALTPLLLPAAFSTQAADRLWSGGTASYTNAANWTGGVVPGPADTAINNNGAGNAVQINAGNGDWTVFGLGAGTGTGSGAFQQNAQTVTVNGAYREVRFGAVAGQSGAYTLNGGTLIFTNGEFDLGILGSASMTINGGAILGSGNFAVNVGTSLSGVSATMDGSTNKDGYTWFEQGFYTTDPTRGVPAAGTTIAATTLPDHTYKMPANYAANSVVMIDTNVASATLTLTTPTALSGLSFLGSAGHGPVAVNYTVHHADSTTETGVLSVPDWFDSTSIAATAAGRVPANGLGIQFINDGHPNLLCLDITLANTTSPVTSVDLHYGNQGGVACLFALSGSTGSGFNPLSFTGANADLVLEANAPIFVANTVTDTVTQSAGTITNTGEVWVGNYGNGTWTMSGGTNNFQNWVAFGRSGGNGTLNMTGGELDKTGNGNLLIGSGFQAPDGSAPSGTLNQSGGVINCGQQMRIPEGGPASGTYNLSGTGVLNVSDWFSIGASGGSGTFTMTGGTINKIGNNNMIIADGGAANGTAVQSGGTITSSGDLWVGQNTGSGTYTLNGTGVLTINSWVVAGRDNGSGVINVDGGILTKGGGNGTHLDIGASGPGSLTQTAGTIIGTVSDTWLAESSSGTWTMNGGIAQLGLVQVARNSSASGNLYLNGGSMSVTEIAGGSGSSSVMFNGGTLVASSSNPNFIHNLGSAYVGSSGLILDTTSNNVTVPQALSDGGNGSLTKNGTGSLTLIGTNNYTGATTVNAGKFATTTASATGGGAYTFANSTEFALAVATPNGQVSAASLTLSGAAHTLDFDLGSFGNPTLAPITVPGTLTVSGTVTINVASAVPAVGQFPLIGYGTKSGSATYVLGALPPGVTAHIVDNTAGHSIDLAITSAGAPRWDGAVNGTPNGNWDINSTPNWVDAATLMPTTYQNGQPTLFDDNATGTTTVNVTTALTPGALTVNNTNLAYSFVGAGSINGSIGLVKQGSGTVAVLNTNGYTGATVLGGGVVSVTNLANGGVASPLGAASANPANLVFAGGTLAYSGPAVAINRGYTVQSGGGTIDTEANVTLTGPVAATSGNGFSKTGPAQLAYIGAGSNNLSGANYEVQAGSLLLDGSAGAQTNTVSGHLAMNGVTGASAILTNTTLNCGDFYMGNQAGMIGSARMENGTTITDNSWFILGDGANATASFTMNGGTLNVPNGRLFLCSAPGTTATFNMNGGTINKSGDYFAVVNGGWNGTGARTGIVNQVSGTINSSSECWVGDGGGGDHSSLGIYNLSGGSLTVNNWFGIGRDGTVGIFNMSGGTLTKAVGGDMVIGRGSSPGFFIMTGGTLTKDSNNPLIVGQGQGVGELDQSGGSITTTGEYWLGVDNGTLATNNISGTAQMTVHNWVTVGRQGTGVVNMSGGQFNADGQPFIVGIWGGSQGYWNQSAGALNVNQEIWIGQGDNNAHGVINLSGGTITNTSWLAVGREGAHGVLNITGGTMVKSGGGNISITHNSGASGDVIISGTGTFICASGETWVGENAGPGTWTMNGGTALLGVVHLAQNADATGVLTLNGGSLTATEISTGNNGATQRELDFNGGTLVAGADNANFIHDLSAANVQAGGALIDTAGHSVSVNQALLGTGALTKVGAGSLYLNGANTYSGATLVNAGTLGGAGSLAGTVTVAAGANLAPGAGVGTLTVNNNVNLGGTLTVEVSRNGGVPTSDLLAVSGALTCGGTLNIVVNSTNRLAVGDTFHILSWGTRSGAFTTVNPPAGYLFDLSQLTVNGTIRVTGQSPAVVNPAVVSNGKLILTGVGGPVGGSYTWLTSTNVAAPLANWTTNTTGVFDSNAAFSNAIPVNTSEPARFFRLRTP